MAITLRGNASNIAGSGALTVTLPAGTAENDVVIAANVAGGTPDKDMAMDTSGYAELADLFSDDNLDSNLGVFWKRMGATPDTTAVFTDLQAGQAAAVEVLIGVDTTTAIDATTTTATAVSAAAPNPPSIDTVTANAWVIAIGGTSEADVPTAPTDYINLIEDQTNNTGVMLATREITSPGTENPGIFNNIVGNTQDSWCAATVALRPAGGGITSGDVDADGTGAAPAIGAAIAASSGAAAGTGAVAAVGAATAASDAVAAGVGAVEAVGEEAGSDVAAAGVGATAVVGASTHAAVVAADGVGATSNVGAATGAGDAAAAGTGAALAIGASTVAGAVDATGAGAVAAVGTATAASDSAASGTGTMSAVAIDISAPLWTPTTPASSTWTPTVKRTSVWARVSVS